MKFHKTLLPVALSFLLLGAGCSFWQTVEVNTNLAGQDENTNATDQNTNTAAGVTYPGQDGKNALELLQSGHTIDVSAEGFVNAIDGVKPGDRQFWAFYVNGEQAQVGARDYNTKNSDQIEWKLEAY